LSQFTSHCVTDVYATVHCWPSAGVPKSAINAHLSSSGFIKRDFNALFSSYKKVL